MVVDDGPQERTGRDRRSRSSQRLRRPPPTAWHGETVAGEAAAAAHCSTAWNSTKTPFEPSRCSTRSPRMVKENPDAAATLVKRWLNRT